MRRVVPSAIAKIKAMQILDSRGIPTVEVDLHTYKGMFRAAAPSDASAKMLVDSMTCAWVLFLLCLQFLVVGCLSTHQADEVSVKSLDVGKELMGEILPLKMGQRLYELHGLKASMWYEVKISYPASIPASFSIQLRRGDDIRFGMNRRLLNTEKLIFKADMNKMESKVYVLVSVEAAGIVAMPHAQERDTVLFNIVCDELSFGIPHEAWLVGIVAVLCLVLAAIAPHYAPSDFLSRNQIDVPKELASSKES